MEPVKSENYQGHTIEIVYDECPLDPRSESDMNLGTIITSHRRYTLGDEQTSDLHQYLLDLAGYDENYIDQLYVGVVGLGYKVIDFDRVMKRIEKSYYILPVYMYDHSGITIKTSSFSDRWDSGLLGCIYVSKKDAIAKFKEWGTKYSKKAVFASLESEIKTYDQYLTGQVYGYQIKDTDNEIIDSCYGYFVDYLEIDSYIVSECKSIIDNIVEKAYQESLIEKIDPLQLNLFPDYQPTRIHHWPGSIGC